MRYIFVLFIFAIGVSGCNKSTDSENAAFESKIYWLENSAGTKIKVMDFGARVMELWVKDKNGKLTDVVLGHVSPEKYIDSPEPYFGATIGRYGNRIANAAFEIDGVAYSLNKNNGENSLHGGPNGFHNVLWKVEETDPSKIVFRYLSKDGEEGFPGNLNVMMVYELSEDNEFIISYEALSDKKTPVNLTHHSFFNLNGEGGASVENHVLYLNASYFTPVSDGLIPNGEIVPVKDSPFDFTLAKPISKDIEEIDEQLAFGGGYDHNWVLDKTGKGKLEPAAEIFSPLTGISMKVITTEPGIQFYSGNFLDGSVEGKSGKNYGHRTAFCLETQHFPDSPNQKAFPSTVLIPGQKYGHTCIYKFDTKGEI